jgi:hypothetical protein
MSCGISSEHTKREHQRLKICIRIYNTIPFLFATRRRRKVLAELKTRSHSPRKRTSSLTTAQTADAGETTFYLQEV